MPIKMVVGLGNPGEEYENTRHNIGHRVLDLLNQLNKKNPYGVRLFKPTGYMNSSGISVSETLRKKGYKPDELLVVCDDFSIPLGTCRIRLGGSSGGHNGLDSIIQSLGTQEIPRLRVGIGPVPLGQDPADFVLKPFRGPDEKAKVNEIIPLVAQMVEVATTRGLEAAMNQYNNKNL